MNCSRNDRSSVRQLGSLFDAVRGRDCEREQKRIRAHLDAMCPRIVLFLLIVGWEARTVLANKERPAGADTVSISKCCELEELLVDDRCTSLSETNETKWQPESLMDQDAKKGLIKSKYELKIGRPRCNPNEHQWHVYYYPSGPDRLVILSTGALRHYVMNTPESMDEYRGLSPPPSVNDKNDEDKEDGTIHYDYLFGHYCADKVVLTGDRLVAMYAMLCVPNVYNRWTDIKFLINCYINPVIATISIVCYLIISLIYSTLPQLCDLVGNIIVSICLCLVVNQITHYVRFMADLPTYSHFVNLLVTDIIMFVSLMAAFIWLTALGYFVWNSFKSPNIYLRVTDCSQYSQYSCWIWCTTICIAGSAIFAHIFLETNKPKMGEPPQETLGYLAISVIFMSIGFTIIINLFLIQSTVKRIKDMNTCGHIHQRMKHNFAMFFVLYMIMGANWLFLVLLQFLKSDTLTYCYNVINMVQAIAILYICILCQRKIMFTVKKTFNCCNPGNNTEDFDWGEEMTAINAGY
ncbi:probable G-protein coupled receptor Mth-like 5 [Pogonomyrmex barbatus]|uniref:Probable G-protein coupled receptor Mth-like 5 n=1 Tax=Pogonomyrmex barbatus TaxID=144034 RepID=A0A6I9WQK9_9HYME|nr:probable G-protein coupled receptor Mth-like 5 [Pogonomyrmex barbatus]